MSMNVIHPLRRAARIAGLLALCAAPLAAQEDTPKLENLGPNVNTEAQENAPVLSPDGRTLYFQRTMPPAREGQEFDFDIYYSTLGPDGKWTLAKPMPAPLNSTDWNGMNSALPDGNTLFVDYVYDNDGTTHNGFSIVHRTARGWGKPQPIVIEGYKNHAKYQNAYLCNDGRTLLLAMQPDEDREDRDLFVCFLQDNGSFSKPMALGSTLNTSEEDASPFLAADGVTLYFSSEGHGGYGNRDIFMSRRLDDSWQKWSEPVNLGSTINTEGFDAYYAISAAGDYAYLASSTNSYGQADIFRIALPKAVKPKPVVLLSGKAFDAKTKQPIEASIRYEVLPGGHEAGRAQATSTEGYTIALPAGARYGVRAEAKGYYPINSNIDLSNVTSYAERSGDLYLVPLEVGSTIRLNNIFFETAKADLKSESFPELDRVVEFLKENPNIRIAIAGHTDNVGSDADNLLLSKNRARAVFDYLVEHGVDRASLTSNGFGESKPIATNDTEEGRQTNRRVEFTIIAQ
jgi:outer membrane protein OmpA-like peptidoglycan-associated protein